MKFVQKAQIHKRGRKPFSKALTRQENTFIMGEKKRNEIKKEAFRENNLVELHLSKNISLIASDSFIDNNYLVDVTIDNGEGSLLNYPWGLNNSNILWLKK